jgi:hypothetical protein
MDINAAEIFAVGTWNGIDISDADLAAIEHSFNHANLAGRVPLAFGHDGPDARDGAPAIGWVKRVWREGKKLLADFMDVPREVYDLVKAGAYKFVSVELLRNAEFNGAVYTHLLDRVALLGKDRPAVTVLEPLKASRMLPAIPFTAREAYSVAFAFAPDDPAPVVVKLPKKAPTQDFIAVTKERDTFKQRAETAEAELVAFKTRVDAEKFDHRAEQLVLTGCITPGQRDRVRKQWKNPAVTQLYSSSVDLLDSIAQPPGTFGYARGLVTGRVRAPGGEDPDNPVPELSAARKARMAQTGEDSFTAGIRAAKDRPDLMGPMWQQFSRLRSNGR